MSEFTVRGRFKSRDGWQEFETEVDAENEDVARERTYANFGGRYSLKRTQIEVEEVEAR
ncbi:50S ribosomal protein L18Ae [Halorussus salilacus]|uniref:50S ribosomal protein L18Ae n=1 Tax=Halorussus salilacus TaxID=2953750 RepID=UPI0020A1E836|nr:50S ribosomal protein L18Ae [Halorussus salilacus]USZ66683.1 50S ribosomal protein L18Ae [Halorussus salilacus]